MSVFQSLEMFPDSGKAFMLLTTKVDVETSPELWKMHSFLTTKVHVVNNQCFSRALEKTHFQHELLLLKMSVFQSSGKTLMFNNMNFMLLKMNAFPEL